MQRAHNERSSASVSLRLKGNNLDPAAVTRELGIEPTEAYRKGDIAPGRRVAVPRPWGGWAIEEQGENVEEVARLLLAKVASIRQLLPALAMRLSAEITTAIWWEPAGGQGGFSMQGELMKQLSELGERLDIYFSSARSDNAESTDSG